MRVIEAIGRNVPVARKVRGSSQWVIDQFSFEKVTRRDLPRFK
jgi:hypothetical protein